MRGIALPVSLAVALLSLGCASNIRVDVDDRHDFTREHWSTWDWRMGTPTVYAPGLNAPALDARLVALIGRGLQERGFERAHENADFWITYHLVLQRHEEFVEVPRAPYELSSLHSSASYLIEGSDRELQLHEDVYLSISLSDASGRTLWRARLARRVRDSSGPRLDEAVAKLLSRLPFPAPES
jgi:hypothetical protein